MIWKKLQAIAIINTVSIVFVIFEPPGHSRVIVIFVGGFCHAVFIRKATVFSRHVCIYPVIARPAFFYQHIMPDFYQQHNAG